MQSGTRAIAMLVMLVTGFVIGNYNKVAFKNAYRVHISSAH